MKLTRKKIKRVVYRPTSKILQDVLTKYDNASFSITELKSALSQSGFGILLAIFCLPLILPIPMPPGYSTIFAIPLFILSLQMIIRRNSPWLPKWIGHKRIRRQRLVTVITKAVPVLQKIEKIIRPRYWPEDDDLIERSIGLFTFIFTCSIAIPLPMTNVPPAFGILVIALGMLARDGIAVIIGKIIGLLGCGLTVGILILGPKAIMSLFGAQ